MNENLLGLHSKDWVIYVIGDRMTYGTGTKRESPLSFGHTEGYEESRTETMAQLAWVTTNTKWCDLMNAEAHMLEQRIFPADILPDFPNYRVNARKCSLGTACNLAGFPCKWAYKEIGDDPFKPTV